MSLLINAIENDSGLAVASKYLIHVVAPFFEMPLTADTAKVHSFKLENIVDELEALVYKIPPSPSSTIRMRFLAEQLTGFANESGVPLGSDDSFITWVTKNGTLEDKVMETVCEIDLFLGQSFSMGGTQISQLQAIQKNLLVNFNILQDLHQTMILGGPGSNEELEAFELAVKTNLKKGRDILDSFDYY